MTLPLSSMKTNTVLDEDAARARSSSAFRRRRKMVISIFTFFFVFLALIIVTLFFYLLREDAFSEDESTTHNRAIQTFYIYSDGYGSDSGLAAFDRIVQNKPIKNPNQIFTLALQKAAEHLEDIKEAEFPAKNWFSLSRSQIAGGLEILRVNPFVEKLSDEQRIIVASVNLQYCLDGLRKSTAEIGVLRAKVVEVQVYVRSCEQFLRNYRGEISGSGGDDFQSSWGRDPGRVVLENLFGLCLCGLGWLFFVFVFWTLCTTR